MKTSAFKRNRWVLAGTALITVTALFLNFPSLWDRMADNLNGLAGVDFVPHFYNIPFKLGLDLQGGTHLVYSADLSEIEPSEHGNAMQGVRDVIERRVNIFGVSEPVIQINRAGSDYRLIVELAGIQNVHEAINMIGETPTLDFREERSESERDRLLGLQESAEEKIRAAVEQGVDSSQLTGVLTEEEKEAIVTDPYFILTSLTGRHLEGATVRQNSQTYQWEVWLQFDDEGAKIFEELTEKNVGKPLAIYLDSIPISAPVVQEKISGGEAQITGNFTPQEAKELEYRLNAGALPVPIDLINQQTIGASLGERSLNRSLTAGIAGFAIILAFMIFYYRLPGVLASLALLAYVIVILAIFKFIAVLTLAGVAGFILSVGMAVDANVLIFERLKEELKAGRELGIAVEEGFNRAWPAIRDGNISTIITCLILFYCATGPVKGFALTLGIGVVVSMLSAIVVTRSFMRAFATSRFEKWI